MSVASGVQYVDSAVNPTMGCGGCELFNSTLEVCYAEKLTQRHAGHPGYPKSFLEPKQFPGRMLVAANWRDLTGEVRQDAPWRNSLPRIIFISDMGDSLSNVPGYGIPFDYLKSEIIDSVSGYSGCRHLWFWLTKRPGRMAHFDRWLLDRDILWPDNLIAATSIVTAATARGRIDSLKKVRAKFKALSVEPLWERVDLDLKGIDWVIVGGESAQANGGTASPFDLDWARSLRDQCRQTGAAFFFKQAGSNILDRGMAVKMKDHHGGDWAEFPPDLYFRDFPQAFFQWNQPIRTEF